MLKQIANKLEVGLSKLQKKQLNEFRNRQRCKGPTGIPSILMTSYGGLTSILEMYEEAMLVGMDAFCIHSPFLLGPPVCDSKSGKISAVFSTRNCLKNVYRQEQSGLPSLLVVDCTYRLMTTKNQGLMIMGTVDVAQHFHLIAFAVVNHEDTQCHRHMIGQVRTALNRVIRECAESGEGI